MKIGKIGIVFAALSVLSFAVIVNSWATENLIWDLQAVDEEGFSTHPKVAIPYIYYVPNTPENLLIIEGISLASWGELDNPDGGGFEYYSVWVQAEADKGGIQAFSGPWMKGMFWSTYPQVQAGDRVRVTGWAAFYTGSGKSFINDRHDESGATMWSIEILSHGDMPEAEIIPLVADCNYFDLTRQGGGERWQTRWTKLKGVEIVDGIWAAGEEVTISDGTGEVLMKLAEPGDFDSFTQPTGKFDVVGVFDQEDDRTIGEWPYYEPPWHDHYRIWVKRFTDLTPQLTINRSSTIAGVDLEWESKSGVTYRLMESGEMENWTQVGDDILGDDTVKIIAVETPGIQYFYKLEHSVE